MASPAEALYALELALAQRDVDAFPGGYDAVLDEAFAEVGSSGRAWTRSEMLELLEGKSRTDAVSIEGFDATEIGPDVYLVRYDTVGMVDSHPVRRRRSSLWLRRGERFVIRFHHGTPVLDEG